MAYFTLKSFDTSGLRAALPRRRTEAERILRETVLSSCTLYVPYRTGALASSGKITSAGVQWTAGHAQRCYYAKTPFRRDKHPLACAGWFEAAKAADLHLWRQKTAMVLAGKEGV